jgi:hypothetical protein
MSITPLDWARNKSLLEIPMLRGYSKRSAHFLKTTAFPGVIFPGDLPTSQVHLTSNLGFGC